MNRADRSGVAHSVVALVEGPGRYRAGTYTMQLPKWEPAVFIPEVELHAMERIPSRGPVGLDVTVSNMSTVDSAFRLLSKGGKLGILNFASAYHPGGGFLEGSMAQEEALCHASTLYSQLCSSPMYELNRNARLNGYYNDSMNVSYTYFFKDGQFEFIPWFGATVVTAAAVNVSALRAKGKVRRSDVIDVMTRRMRFILEMFIREGCDVLVLGAFGCGVFGNDPFMIASIWNDLLLEYGGYFRFVDFAVLDKPGGPNITAFQSVFKGRS